MTTANAGRTMAWCAATLLLVFLCAWPVYAGMVAVDDDIKFVRGDKIVGTYVQSVRAAWNTSGAFRPMEILMGMGCDPVTLTCPWVLVVQAVGLGTLAVGAIVLIRRIVPGHPMAAPLLLMWLALSPATTASLWQMDTGSQTWSAALAVWAGVAAWRAVMRAREGRMDWVAWVALLILFAVGLTIKEIFYGWSAGVGTALGVTALWMWRKDSAAARRVLVYLVPVVVLPAVHLAARYWWGGLGSPDGSHDRYSVTLGENLLLNGAFSLAGVLTNGPLHLIRDDAALAVLRVLPLVSVLLAVCAIGAAAGFRWLHRAQAGAIAVAPVFVCGGAGVLSLAVTIPMGSVSELYGFGANVGSGIWVVGALTLLWWPSAADERFLCRGIAIAAAVTLGLSGVYGLGSRAYHFALTWEYARTLNTIVMTHQSSMTRSDIRPPAVVYLGPDCTFGRMHSTYVVTPVRAIGAKETGPWLDRHDPNHLMVLSIEDPAYARAGIDLVVDCKNFPARAHW